MKQKKVSLLIMGSKGASLKGDKLVWLYKKIAIGD
jgi:hypothetical protein